ncbi:MAG: HAD hydrolase-like protein [Pseudomonadota bacterium]
MTGQTLSKINLDGWTIVFDLDGTLVETAPDLLNALNHVLGKAGYPPVGLDDMRTMIGRGAKVMIQQGLDAHGAASDVAKMGKLWEQFLDFYRSNIAVESYPYPGLLPVLEMLKRSGARLAVCTNKTQSLTDALLAALDLSTFFDGVIGADSVPSKKPDGDHILRTITATGGDPSRAIMVGDSRTDERAALDAGLPFIFVTFGYEETLPSEIAANAVINHYSEFAEALGAIVN